jgi:hypothetical protein
MSRRHAGHQFRPRAAALAASVLATASLGAAGGGAVSSAASTAAVSSAPASTAAPKALKPYTGRWYSLPSALELRQFTRNGVAHIEWGGRLPCTSSGCPLKITVKFTTSGQTSTRLNGKVTWINHQVKQAHSFTVGEKVRLLGAPSSHHVVFESPDADSAQLCRTIHSQQCAGET